MRKLVIMGALALGLSTVPATGGEPTEGMIARGEARGGDGTDVRFGARANAPRKIEVTASHDRDEQAEIYWEVFCKSEFGETDSRSATFTADLPLSMTLPRLFAGETRYCDIQFEVYSFDSFGWLRAEIINHKRD